MKLLLLCCLLFAGTAVLAQNNFSATNFRTGQQAFTDISSTGTSIAMTNNESGASASPVDIGFSFNYNGTLFTQCMIHADGILRFGTAAPGAATDIAASPGVSHAAVFTSTAAAFQNVVMPFFTNLVSSASTPQFHVLTTGTAPNRVCTIQWKDLRDANNAGGGTQFQAESLSFAVNLYETSNDIEFVYGNFMASATAAFIRNAAVGIKASATSFLGVYKQLAAAPFSKATCFTPTNHGFVNASFPFTRNALPLPGRAFRFYGRIANDVNVAKIYYDSISTAGLQRTGRTEALVVNEGTAAQSNIIVTLSINGANSVSIDANIGSLAAGASQIVSFPEYSVSNKGTQTITVSTTLAGDERAANNSFSVNQLVSQSRSQTPDATLQSSLGVGFNGAAGFNAVKVYGSGTRKVRQIRLPISSYRNAISVRIYEDGGSGGSPSTTPIASTSSFFSTSENAMVVSFPAGVTVVDDYYVVVHQTTTENMGWRVVLNPPVRISRTYTSSFGTSWSPQDIGRPWQFLLDVFEENTGPDVGIDSIVSPGCNYSNDLDIKVRLRNFSANAIDFSATPATITGAVSNPSNAETPFTITKNSGTLAPGASEDITVLTGYNYLQRGYYLFRARTNLPGDEENGNDSLRFFISNGFGATTNFTDSLCPLQSVTLTGSSFLASPQWNVNGQLTNNAAVTLQPTASTVAYFSGTDYRGCRLTDSVIVPVRTLGIPPKPDILYKDTIFSHRIGFADTFRVVRQAGHTISWQGPGTALGDSAYVLRGHGLSFAPVRAIYTRTSDGCSNISDQLRISYAPGVLLNNSLALTLCDSSFYDAGGGTGATGSSFTRTFTPATPGTKMKLTIYALDLAANASLFIHDGPTTATPRIAALSNAQNGNTMREFIASNESGVLTVRFNIGSANSSGWLAGLTCHTPEVYRSVQNGLWTAATTWEKKAPGGDFEPAARAPLKGDDSIYIRHDVLLNVSTQTDQVTVIPGAHLRIEPISGFISINMYKTNSQPPLDVKGTLSLKPNVQLLGADQLVVSGNLQNEGSIDTDSVIMNGNTLQQLGTAGGAKGSIKLLHVNNPAGIQVVGTQQVLNLRFVQGLVNTSSSAFIEIDGNAQAEGNNASHINGPAAVTVFGSNDRYYPVGLDGQYRPVAISNNDANSSDDSETILVQPIAGAPPTRTLPSSITSVSQGHFYRITRTGNNGRDYTVTLPYTSSDGVTDPPNLTIAKDNGSGAWQDIGGTATGPAPGTITSGSFDSFSDFVLATKSGSLPVTWVSFTANPMGQQVQLKWETGTETGCKLFVVERSQNGRNFSALAKQPCSNNRLGGKYSHTDTPPANGTWYYRIKQQDDDGNVSYSATRLVELKAGNHYITVYPNPASSVLRILHLNGREMISLYDAAGKLMGKYVATGGNLEIPVAHLANGLYTLQVLNPLGLHSYPIVIAR